MGRSEKQEQYSEQEAQRRFEKALRAGLNTPPKPLKDMSQKRPTKPNPKPRGKASKSA